MWPALGLNGRENGRFTVREEYIRGSVALIGDSWKFEKATLERDGELAGNGFFLCL